MAPGARCYGPFFCLAGRIQEPPRGQPGLSQLVRSGRLAGEVGDDCFAPNAITSVDDGVASAYPCGARFLRRNLEPVASPAVRLLSFRER